MKQTCMYVVNKVIKALQVARSLMGFMFIFGFISDGVKGWNNDNAVQQQEDIDDWGGGG